MAGTDTCIYSGSKAHAPGTRAGRCRADAEGCHLAAKQTGIGVRWFPSGVGYGSQAALPGSRKCRDLGWGSPARAHSIPSPPIVNSALARVLGSEWRKRIPAYTTAPMQMHRVPGVAGADRTQKVASWLSKKTGLDVRWYPIGIGYGSLAAPPGSRFSRF
eukprot:gene23763-biopygen20846